MSFMVLMLSLSLCISIIGMVLLLGVKRYELSNGKVFFASVRPGLGAFTHMVSVWVTRVLPALIKHLAIRARRSLESLLHKLVARAALLVEYVLEKGLHIVRETTTSNRAQGEVSPFLREVADHKKKLLKRSKSNRIILDE
jgi:hypothetical protein